MEIVSDTLDTFELVDANGLQHDLNTNPLEVGDLNEVDKVNLQLMHSLSTCMNTQAILVPAQDMFAPVQRSFGNASPFLLTQATNCAFFQNNFLNPEALLPLVNW